MPMYRITIDPDGTPKPKDARPDDDLRLALRNEGTGPVVVMVHGYKYLPDHSRHCPHRSLLSVAPQVTGRRILSWPRLLGFGSGDQDEGLGISFGWAARGSIWAAHRRAQDAGDALARVLTRLRQLDADRPVHIVAHSLGARVALRALSNVAPDTVQKAVLLSAAEFDETARQALTSSGGQSCEVLNVTSRENDLFDFLLERLITPPRRGDRIMGHGGLRLPNLVSLQLDDKETLTRLACAGFPIPTTPQHICHWSTYLRPGVFPLYRAFLSDDLTFVEMRRMLPGKTAPRWSRLSLARLGGTSAVLRGGTTQGTSA